MRGVNPSCREMKKIVEQQKTQRGASQGKKTWMESMLPTHHENKNKNGGVQKRLMKMKRMFRGEAVLTPSIDKMKMLRNGKKM